MRKSNEIKYFDGNENSEAQNTLVFTPTNEGYLILQCYDDENYINNKEALYGCFVASAEDWKLILMDMLEVVNKTLK